VINKYILEKKILQIMDSQPSGIHTATIKRQLKEEFGDAIDDSTIAHLILSVALGESNEHGTKK